MNFIQKDNSHPKCKGLFQTKKKINILQSTQAWTFGFLGQLSLFAMKLSCFTKLGSNFATQIDGQYKNHAVSF